MKKELLLALVIVTVAVLVFGACAKPAPAPAPERTWELKYSTHSSPTSPTIKSVQEPWCTMIAEATNNRVKINMYVAESLSKAKDQYDAVVTGIADVAWVVTSYTPGRFPLTEIIVLPGLDIASNLQATYIMWELYEKFPEEFAKEYTEVKVLFIHTNPTQILCANKPVRRVEDVRGMKIRVVGAGPTAAVKAWGAIPVTLPYTEVYSAMEKGVIDGAIVNWYGQHINRLYEVADYFTEVNLGIVTTVMTMNLETWNSFPPDIQEQIWSVSGLKGAEWYAVEMGDKPAIESRQAIGGMAGKEIITLSPEEMAGFNKVAEPIHAEYVAKLEAKGLPGQAIYAEMLRLIEKYR